MHYLIEGDTSNESNESFYFYFLLLFLLLYQKSHHEYKQVTAILTFLSFANAFILWDQNFQNSKETEMLQKNFKLAITKVRNYKIQ